MAVARKDDNGYAAWCGISCLDCKTPVRIKIDSATGGLLLDSTTIISCSPSTTFQHTDDNGYPVARGISSTNSANVLPLYVLPSTGAVLADIA